MVTPKKEWRKWPCNNIAALCREITSTAPSPRNSAVERATPGEEVPGSIPAVAARSLQVGSVSV